MTASPLLPGFATVVTAIGIQQTIAACAVAGLLAGCSVGGGGSTVLTDRQDFTVTAYSASIEDGLSGEVIVDVPDDVQSLLMEVRGTNGKYYLTKFQSPSGGDLIEAASYATQFAREVPGLVDWLYPNSPTLSVEPGKYHLLLRGETAQGGKLSEDVEIRVYTKKTQSFDTCSVALDFLVDTSLFGNKTDDQLDTELFKPAVEWFDKLYVPHGVRVRNYSISKVTLGNSNFDTGATDVTKHISPILDQARETGDAREESVHLVLVGSIGGADPIGYSMGLPGPFDADRPNAAVLISLENSVYSGGMRTSDDIASTMAHETGHYLGLYHVSEMSGDQNDPIPDTPQCPPDCGPTFTGNIMAPSGGATRHLVTDGQAYVMHKHPLCEPEQFDTGPAACNLTCNNGETCSSIGGDQQCRQACELPDPSCDTGTCKPDDLGTLVCSQ